MAGKSESKEHEATGHIMPAIRRREQWIHTAAQFPFSQLTQSRITYIGKISHTLKSVFPHQLAQSR